MHIPISGFDIIDSVFSQIPDANLFNWFVNNIDQVCEVLDKLLHSSIGEKKDILILSNHATWFNLPRIFKIPKENIYTIIGPAITHSQFSLAGILRFSNALKTSPDTPKADIGYEKIQEMRKVFFEEITEIVKKVNSTKFSRVFLLAPSGTTDQNSGANIIMSQPSGGTETLVRLLIRKLKLTGFAI